MVDHHLFLNQEFKELLPLTNQQFKEPLKDQLIKLHPVIILEQALAQELDLAQELAHQAIKLEQLIKLDNLDLAQLTKLDNLDLAQLTNNPIKAVIKVQPKEVEQLVPQVNLVPQDQVIIVPAQPIDQVNDPLN